MALIVQKFGGTSVADPQKILAAARRAIRTQQAGHDVVVVVSAMGHQTDELIDLAGKITERPPARELDMLLSTGEQISVALMAMAVHELGSKAVSLTGGQMGILTDSRHGKARIQSIDATRLRKFLAGGNIVIAAGFQGIDEHFNITTLGRGGSDTTAVALAAALDAAACEIYTDVDGVYTTDPRLLPEARRMRRISYDEMLELASLGAGVMHNRAVEFGKKYQVPIHVRSSFSDIEGSMIIEEPETWSQMVTGCAVTKHEARVSLYDVPDVPGTLWEIFYRMADRGVTVDMVVQNIGGDGKADVSFTVPQADREEALEAAREAAAELGGAEINEGSDVAKVSVVGLGMAEETGVARKMFDALHEAGVNIQMITTSEIKISVLVGKDDAAKALRAVHKAFALDRDPVVDNDEEAAAATRRRPKIDPADLANRLATLAMEDLFIGDIALDDEQARLTIEGIPNRPGIAASLFRKIAEANIFVDMIVQSFNSEETAEISFTVPVEEYAAAREVTERVAAELGATQTSASESVAKLSVFGIGLQSHTGVGLRMFECLAKAGINIEIVSTSEVRVNVVVDSKDGPRALSVLQQEFAEFKGT